MSQFYVPGPAYVFPGVLQNYAFTFFGFTERGLTVTRSGSYEDVNVDYSGAMPGDVSMLGQEARVSGDFTRYNEDVSEVMATFYNTDTYLDGGGNIVGIPPGSGGDFSVGTLMAFEGGAFPLIIYCPYGAKNEFGTMVKTFYFPSVYIADQHEVALSVRRKAPRMSWRAIPTFGSFTNGVFSPGAPYIAYQLYSYALPSGVTISSLIAAVN